MAKSKSKGQRIRDTNAPSVNKQFVTCRPRNKNGGIRFRKASFYDNLRESKSELEHVEHVVALGVPGIQASEGPVPLDESEHRYVVHLHVRDIAAFGIGRDHDHGN